MGLLNTIPTQEMVESLSIDIARNPHYHEEYWQNFNPDLRAYLVVRAKQLQKRGADGATNALTLLVELSSLEERFDFGQDMEAHILLEPSSVATAIGQQIVQLEISTDTIFE